MALDVRADDIRRRMCKCLGICMYVWLCKGALVYRKPIAAFVMKDLACN